MSLLSYQYLVLDLLSQQKYPVLQDFVVMDIYYKSIPANCCTTDVESVRTVDRLVQDPESAYAQDNTPYGYTYLVTPPFSRYFSVCHTNNLDTSRYPLQCQSIKLSRSLVDQVLSVKSRTFEEELYRFIAHLNFDVPKIRDLLDLEFDASTRFLPESIQMGVFKYHARPINSSLLVTHCCSSEPNKLRSCFGPPENTGIVLPTRMIEGKLAPCTSTQELLSLNDDIEAKLAPPYDVCPYTAHYSTRWNTVVPLAYNPLENPIM